MGPFSNSGIIRFNPSTKEIIYYYNKFPIDPVFWAKMSKNREGRIFIPVKIVCIHFT